MLTTVGGVVEERLPTILYRDKDGDICLFNKDTIIERDAFKYSLSLSRPDPMSLKGVVSVPKWMLAGKKHPRFSFGYFAHNTDTVAYDEDGEPIAYYNFVHFDAEIPNYKSFHYVLDYWSKRRVPTPYNKIILG